VFSHHEPRALKSARDLELGLAQDRRGRVFAILCHEPSPVLWNVGRISHRGTLRLPGTTLHRRAIRPADRKLRPLEAKVTWDAAATGQCYVHVDRPGVAARVVGRVLGRRQKGERPQWVVVYARFNAGRLEGFRKRPQQGFRRRWKPADITLPDWHECLAAMQTASA
jgi:hypothetical protein